MNVCDTRKTDLFDLYIKCKSYVLMIKINVLT